MLVESSEYAEYWKHRLQELQLRQQARYRMLPMAKESWTDYMTDGERKMFIQELSEQLTTGDILKLRALVSLWRKTIVFKPSFEFSPVAVDSDPWE